MNGHCAIYFIHMLGKQKVNLKLTQKTKNKTNMGNYKSRPQSSCSEELRKKISELHVTIKKKLNHDLKVPLPNEMR